MFRKSIETRKKKNKLPKELKFLCRNYLGLLDILKLKFSGAYNTNLKISLCTSVKDRFEHLQTTFLRNIEDNASYPNCEFVLLNYNCPDPRTERWVKNHLQPFSLLGLTQKYILWENFCRTILHSDELRTRHLSQDKQTSLSQQKAIYENNVERGIICPNGSRFGNGRVQKNFVEWLEV